MAQSPITNITSDQLISSFTSVHKPEEFNTLFRKYGDQGLSFFNMLNALGFKMPAAQTTFGWSEEDWIFDNFHSKNTESAPGAGNPITITLEAADLDGSNRFFPQQRDVVHFKNNVPGVITNVNVSSPSAPVLTIEPLDSSDDIGIVSAGDEVAIISNMSGEGTDQQSSVTSRTIHETNDMQIIKDDMVVTGSEMTNQTWFTSDSDGRSIPVYYIKNQFDLDYRMTLRMDGALLEGKKVTNTTADPTNGDFNLRGTEGILPKTRANGINIPHTPGQFTIAKFDEINDRLDRVFAGNNICGLLGYRYYLDLKNSLVDFFKDTNIQYAQKEVANDLFGGDEALAGTMDWQYLVTGERKFMFKKMGVFNHPKYLGSAGHDHPNYGLYLPLNQKKDAKTGNRMPQFGMRYKELNGYSRLMEHWVTGGAGTDAKTDSLDLMRNHQRSEIGAQHMGANQFVLHGPQ